MKQKFIDLYMDWAQRCAQLSHAVRLQVGAVIVKDDSVISYGYNGMPAGWDNNCEDEIVEYPENMMMIPENEYRYLKTKPEVIHAERNALDKLAKGNEGGLGATMFITHAPCLECAKSIYGAGISTVYYRAAYRDTAGVDFLDKCDISVSRL